MQTISLRKFPYPYRAMLAISTDIDSTTLDNLRYIHKTLKNPLNGIGLDIADSIWAFAPRAANERQLAFMDIDSKEITPYWKEIKFYIDKGWIDTLHSYGNFSKRKNSETKFSRLYAEKTENFFNENNITLDVWVNHGDEANIQNIGYHNYNEGDKPKCSSYHIDIMQRIGIKYIWNPKIRTHFGHDTLLIKKKLRDSSLIWSFPRFSSTIVNQTDKQIYEDADCKFWGNFIKNEAVLWYPNALHLQIQKDNLELLCQREQFSIITQHLGYIIKTDNQFTQKNLDAFKLLKSYEKDGKIKIASTSKVLNYNRIRDFVDYSIITEKNITIINIKGIDDPILGYSETVSVSDLRGLTFYCSNPDNTFIAIKSTLIQPFWLIRSPSDGIASSIGIAWEKNEYDDLSSRYQALQILSSKNKKEQAINKKVNSNNKKSLWERTLNRAKKLAKNNNTRRKLVQKKIMPKITPAICIGGMKCGTTTLWNLLKNHPEILPCVTKEPSYFGRKNQQELSRDTYFSVWPWEKASNKSKIAFEASTHYTKFPQNPDLSEEMFSIVPDAKLIYIMRNPIERIESQLAHHISRNEMELETFKNGKWKNIKHLFNLSSYAMQIDQFAKYFNKNNIMLILFEDMVNNHKDVLKKICTYLEIDNYIECPNIKADNLRRKTQGAEAIKLTDSDKDYIKNKLKDDILTLKNKYNVDITKWNIY